MNTNLNYVPKILVDTTGLSNEEWLEYRRKGIGGSDAAAILGINPYKTAKELYLDKIGNQKEEPKGLRGRIAIEVGNRLEDLVADLFAEVTGYEVIKMPFMYYHPQYPFMLANVDRLILLPDGSTAILECKTAGYNVKEQWDNNTIPAHYRYQGMHYMCVMNISKVFFACLYDNNIDSFIRRELSRDMDLENELIFYEQEFWHGVLNRQPPKLEGNHKAIEKYLKKYCAGIDPKLEPIKLDEVFIPGLREYFALKEEKSYYAKQEKELEIKMNTLIAPVLEALGEHPQGYIELGNGSRYVVDYKPQNRVSVPKQNLELLQCQHPEVYTQYATASTNRVLSAKQVEAKNKKKDVA